LSRGPVATVGRLYRRRVDRQRLLDRLVRGSLHNVGFADAQDLVEALGFRLVRRKGSHRVFAHPGLPELLNLQNVNGEAKPYQLRQLVRLIRGYPLKLEDGT
jgi:hypothetical protein